ncbi:GntR family transcriptional regulator [Microbacterium sp. NPDC076911]|uniref:GntR family transcriptional regulator n=1 Tax=Microbacterium sp. NPDC076911 TaxID=3154958 RepID=UPI0034438160
MLVRIEPTSDEPLFEQIAASIRSDAAAGRLRSGDRLPPAREVATALDVNLHTVLRAYQDLRDEGLVDMRRGRGAVVTDAVAALAQLRNEIDELVAQSRHLGISPELLTSLVKEIAHDR